MEILAIFGYNTKVNKELIWLAKQTITLTNLLTNPSFENTGWVANSACSIAYVTSPKHSGSYSLKVTSTSSSESLI